ncbi:hypothetical protein JMM81_19820 [Bacillus sp. V3B]|uniref:hypothetical protein n=1 Tax=Bacillus sp. V3B TaxID=2804915 RepID=UPI00210F058E|nr:hypothetical protein [Bacillus sp. V3B]MCQ6277127.1 hypothetical protein [Bacillus sp. V3B]
MQINQQIIHHQRSATSDAPLELKKGEVYRASIKEKLNSTDAILHIRGKEVHAKFSEGVPATENRVTVLVDGGSDQMVNVKTITTENVKTASSEEKVFTSLGLTGKGEADLKQAVRILLDKGSPLSKEAVGELKAFMDQPNGTRDSKMETVRALANKRLEATLPQLRAVHEALHGKPLNEVLSNIAKEIDPAFKLEKTERPSGKQSNPVPQKENVPASTLKETGNQPVVEKSLNKTVSESIKPSQSTQSAPTTNTSELSSLVRKSRETFEKEPDLKRAITQVREEIIKNPKIDRELAQKIEKAAQEAEKLQSIGKERLVQALKGAEDQLLKKEQSPVQTSSSVSQPNAISANRSQEVKLTTVVNDLKIEVSKNPNINRSIDKIREQIVENPRFSKEVAEKVDRVLNEASSLGRQGRITTGKEVLSRVLTDVQNTVDQAERRANQQVDSVQEKASSGPQVERSTTEPRPSEMVKMVRAEVQNEPNLQRAVEKVREQVVTNPKMDREVTQRVEQVLKEAVQLQQIGRESTGRERLQQAQATQIDRVPAEPRPSEVVKQVRTEVQSEPNLQRAVEKVRDQVVTNPKMDREVAQKVEQALKEATQLQRVGQETAGRDRVQQALIKAEVDLKQNETRQPTQQVQPSQINQETIEPRLSEVVKQARTEVQNEPNLQRAVEKVRDQVVTNPKMDREVAQKVEQALKEATQLQRVGQETAGRDRVQQALTKAEVDLKQIETRQPAQPTQQATQPTQDSQLRESIKRVREQIQIEPDTKKIVQKVQDLVTNNKHIDPETTRNIERLANQANQLDQAGRDRLTKMLQQVETTIEPNKAPQNVSSTTQKEQQTINHSQQQNSLTKNPEMVEQAKTNSIRPSESINQALKQLQREPNLEKALDQVRKEITSNPDIDLNTIDKAEKALNQATQLQDKGREMGARQHITKELTEIQQQLAKTEPKINMEQKSLQEQMQYELNEQLQSLNIQSKDILVTKVTEKLAQATHDFRELKREITRNLDSVERVINTFKKNAYPQAKQMLETAISKLDNAILKSDMMLFTDMKTEKQLMNASSQLADAKKLLAKGDHAEAGRIVNEVKTLIDKLIFKPSEQKVMHYVNKESTLLGNSTPKQQMLSQYSEATHGTLNQEPSARQMYETVRSLGLNHESDVANSLVFHKNGQSQQEQQQQQNLKEVLMKLAQGEGQENNPKITQQAEQALTNLTGQQLLSKSDASGTLQSMFFNLPLMLGGKPENLQVFINSKNEGQQVEWENCNLYFLLETKKLGDVGILLNSTDRNLSITIKNDLPGFKEKIEPLASFTKEKLQEVGYNVSSINFAKMNPVRSQSVSQEELGSEMKQVKETRQIFNEKGMNFTI